MSKLPFILKRLLEFFLYLIIKCALFLRYRIKVTGKENLNKEALSKPGGILFLANHPAEIDPLILLSIFWFPYKPHPIAIDYLFRKPFVRSLMDIVGALSVPNFDISSNSYKRKQIEKTYERIFSYLEQKENILIYPAGSLKNGPEEVIGGASGVHTILEKCPDANIVLIRSLGLWGSSFSRAPTGRTPDILQAFSKGFRVLLRNFIFFAPRRKVIVEIEPAPKDFPWKAERRELNRYLEKWYNAKGPEPLNLVSFSFFREDYPAIKEKSTQEKISLEDVPPEIKERVFEEISKLSRLPVSEITEESHLAQDLGFDSLDIAQLAVALKENFGVGSLNTSELTTVAAVLAYAAKLKTERVEEEDKEKIVSIWEGEKNRPTALYPVGETLIEVFLRTCERMDGYIACVDQVAQEISYRKLKMGVLLLADAIRKMSGERIGIMMPASVGVNAMILAVMLAKKIPVMVNWTLGERNLQSVVEQSKICITLSSWQFLDRLDNVELNGIDDQIILLEDLRRSFSLFSKLKAFYRSYKSTKSLLKLFDLETLHPDEPAVILFTSGTESFPKGVPLSHRNILTNQKAAYSLASLQSSDVLLGALPPFHSFGFSVTGLLPLLAGLRVAYSPNPTDGRRMADAIARWEVTLLCLAPTFLKNLLRVANPEHLQTLRVVVAGAEKTASELYEKLSELNNSTILIEGYGITECAPILTLNPPDKPSHGVGLALPGVEIKIVNPETLAPVAEGEQGLILARGPNVFQGYLDPALSSPFVECEGKSWYNTGDLGYLNSNHYLSLSGRLKRFVKIGGEMVSLTAIEETFQQAASKRGWKLEADVPSFAVCSLEQDGKKSEIHLFTVVDTSTDEVNQILRESGMSNIIKIRSVKKVPYIPLLGSGKIDYRSLASKLNNSA